MICVNKKYISLMQIYLSQKRNSNGIIRSLVYVIFFLFSKFLNWKNYE